MSSTALLVFLAAWLAGLDVTRVMKVDDYPGWAQRKGQSAAALVDLLIAPDGRIVRCEIIQGVGSDELSRTICKTVQNRRAIPARDAKGIAVHGHLRTLLKMFLPETEGGRQIAASASPPDVILSVSRLPEGRDKADVEVLAALDETGRVTDCSAAVPESEATLVKVVCGYREGLARSVAGADGRRVRYVTKLKVRLTAGTAPAKL